MLNELYHSLSPVLFSIGPITVRWYGLGYVFGFLLAAVLAMRICKRWEIKFSSESLLTLLIACLIGTILGGRLGYILFYGNGYYFAHPQEIFVFSGMSFHGGLIGFAIGVIITSRIIRMPLGTLADLSSICAPIGLGLVRCANFINGELWGATTDLPWGVVFDGAGPLPRHPTQLYEAFLEGVVLLLVLYLLSRRRPPLPRGSYTGVFLIGYGVFRIAIEFIRQPDIQLGYLFGTEWITMGMVLSLPMVLIGIGVLAYAARSKLPQAGEAAAETEETEEFEETEDSEESEEGFSEQLTDDEATPAELDAHEEAAHLPNESK